jgi:hypothetical protein
MDILEIFRTAKPFPPGGTPAKKAKKRKPVAKPAPKLKKKNKKPLLYDPAAYPSLTSLPKSQPLKAFFSRPYQFAILPLRLFDWTIGFQLMNQDPSIRACWEARKVPKGCPESSKVYARAIVKMLQHRQLFRRFVHRWRASRLRAMNTEDCITLEPVKNPIWIVDWEQRTKTAFEAQTLHKDITERLMFHDGFFEDPQLPRNPMTNLPLTQAQILSVWDQISRAGIPVSTAFVLFRRARWSMDTYLTESETFLKLHAFRDTMKDIGHIDTQERMLDFIQYCYELESLDCAIPAFKYALQYFPKNKTICEWQKLCTSFYEAHILYSRMPQKLEEKKNAILDKTDTLLDKQAELIRLRVSDMRIRRQAAAEEASRAEESLPLWVDPFAAQQLELLNLQIDLVPGSQIPMSVAAEGIAAILNSMMLGNN